MTLLRRLKRVPIINPPFADTAGNYLCIEIVEKGCVSESLGR
jgi:hypothetical protein